MELIGQLSPEDKEIVVTSLPVISKNMEFFIIRFYHYLMKTPTNQLFKDTDFEKQYHMFQMSIKIILAHINNPSTIANYFQKLALKHIKYDVTAEHAEYYSEAIVKTLEEIFHTESDQFIVTAWRHVIVEIMENFSEQL